MKFGHWAWSFTPQKWLRYRSESDQNFHYQILALDLVRRYQNKNSQMNFWAESETKRSGSLGNFSGASHSDNRGPTVTRSFLILSKRTRKDLVIFLVQSCQMMHASVIFFSIRLHTLLPISSYFSKWKMVNIRCAARVLALALLFPILFFWT